MSTALKLLIGLLALLVLPSLSEGQPAPDFTLPTLDTKAQVTLSSHRGQRPVVLVFGSYT